MRSERRKINGEGDWMELRCPDGYVQWEIITAASERRLTDWRARGIRGPRWDDEESFGGRWLRRRSGAAGLHNRVTPPLHPLRKNTSRLLYHCLASTHVPRLLVLPPPSPRSPRHQAGQRRHRYKRCALQSLPRSEVFAIAPHPPPLLHCSFYASISIYLTLGFAVFSRVFSLALALYLARSKLRWYTPSL